MILFLDIDGTLSNFSHRLHLLGNDPSKEDFERFLDPILVRADDPFPKAQQVISMIRPFLYSIHFITGRREGLRSITESWLLQHFDILPTNDSLHMRPEGEYTTASSHKKIQVEKVLSKIDHYGRTLVFIEDDPYVLPIYSMHGLTLKAPQCWDLFLHATPKKKEELFSK